MWLYNTHNRAGESLTVSFDNSQRTVSRFNINLDFKVLDAFTLHTLSFLRKYSIRLENILVNLQNNPYMQVWIPRKGYSLI